MSDRELLELAAKAAGHTGFTFINGEGAIYQPEEGKIQPYRRWSPLTDDGDALRLAVTKRLCVHVQEKCAWAFQDGDNIVGDTAASSLVMFSDTNGDALYAVRLAITRAAAEIGRRMPHE